MGEYRIGVIGLGKIAQDQHLPVIAKNPAFELAAVSSQRGLSAGAALAFRSHEELLSRTPDLHAVAICTPPVVRHSIARAALAAGVSVMLEKPPTATLSELADLQRFAEAQDKVLMTTWHSQYNAGVDEAKRLLSGKRVSKLFVNWKEDVRKWHPGQAWIFEAGGFGVFDPGINALSIVTKIMPEPVFIKGADLFIPSNADAPIAANLTFSLGGREGAFTAEMDWRPIEREIWEIHVETTDDAIVLLSSGGARLSVDGRIVVDEKPGEYEAIYKHFGQLLEAGTSHIDADPIRLVADAFMIGRRQEVDAFNV